MQNDLTTPAENINHLLHPDPILAAENLSISSVHRFFGKVRKTESCWLWTGARDCHGGVMGRGAAGSGNIMSRKVAWLIYFGPLPVGRIRNSCRDSLCVNPAHLQLKYGAAMPACVLSRADALLTIDPEQDPTLPPGFSRTFLSRFWSKVDRSNGPNACWLWTASLNDDGYGIIGRGWNQPGNVVRAHQASWMIHNGPIPDGLVVRHVCPGFPKPHCVNPLHLAVGTCQQNSQDAARLIREAKQAYWNATLTVEQVLEIRRLVAEGRTNVAIARQFNVNPCHVSAIKHRRSWKHIP